MSALIPLLVTLPLLGAAVALFFGRARRVQVGVSLVTLTLVLVIAAVLLYTVDSTGQALAVSVGGWPIPFGIVLYVASRRYEPAEEAELAARFGPAWDRYRGGVLLPGV